MIRFLSASYKIISGSFEVSSRILIPNSDNRLSSLCNVRSDVSPIYNNSAPDAKLGTNSSKIYFCNLLCADNPNLTVIFPQVTSYPFGRDFTCFNFLL